MELIAFFDDIVVFCGRKKDKTRVKRKFVSYQTKKKNENA